MEEDEDDAVEILEEGEVEIDLLEESYDFLVTEEEGAADLEGGGRCSGVSLSKEEIDSTSVGMPFR